MKPSKDSLGDRMKGYELVSRHRLVRRTPVVLRVDGKAFHTLTRGLDKPWDAGFMEAMQGVAMALCENIQGAQLAYGQSDEVSVLLTDYATHDTQAWFDYSVQKTTSVAASIATAEFGAVFRGWYPKVQAPAWFDARVFNLPKEEVVNYFLWRQQDATRNSIQGLAQSQFSHRELQGLNCKELQEKLFTERGLNWNDTPTAQKRGYCVRRAAGAWRDAAGAPTDNALQAVAADTWWQVDTAIPVFSEDRAYIEALL